MPTPRLPPLPKEVWSDDAVAALRTAFGDAAAEHFFATGPDAPHIPNVLGVLAHHPELAQRFLAYNTMLLMRPTLEPRWRELMILRVAWRTRSLYEWAQHVGIASACDIAPEEIAAIPDGSTAPIWDEMSADLLAATDQMLDDYRIDDETWARLAERLDERQLVELTFVVGTYAGLAMAFNSFGLQLDPDIEDVPGPRPAD